MPSLSSQAHHIAFKVYTAASITSENRSFVSYYQAINEHLKALGATILCAHVAQPVAYEATTSPQDVYTRNVNWIRESDCLIAEISLPSLGVGYEIAMALSQNIPVLCLHYEKVTPSKMITGNTHPLFTVRSYATTAELRLQLEQFSLLLKRQARRQDLPPTNQV